MPDISSMSWEERRNGYVDDVLSEVKGAQLKNCEHCIDGYTSSSDERNFCSVCNGFGIVWFVPFLNDVEKIKDIEARWGIFGSAEDIRKEAS